MGKIYFNADTSKIRYLEEEVVTNRDILFSSISGHLVLASINDVRVFAAVDPYKDNYEVVKNLLKSGYRPINGMMDMVITQNYSICPHCGNEIDINEPSDTVILDSGDSLKRLAYKTMNIAKELECSNCSYRGLFYYDIYAQKEDMLNFFKESASDGADLFVRYRHVIDGGKRGAHIPIIFDFGQFLQFFKDETSGSLKSDFEISVEEKSSTDLIRLLFNSDFHKVVESKDAPLLDNIRVELKPIQLGKYSSYITKLDYDVIVEYSNVADDQAKLKALVLS